MHGMSVVRTIKITNYFSQMLLTERIRKSRTGGKTHLITGTALVAVCKRKVSFDSKTINCNFLVYIYT